MDVFGCSARAWAVRDAAGPLLGAIPLDPAISRAANTGRPVLLEHPDSPQAAAFATIAVALLERLGGRG